LADPGNESILGEFIFDYEGTPVTITVEVDPSLAATKKVEVLCLERYIQRRIVEVPRGLDAYQTRNAALREIEACRGTDVGGLEFHSTDNAPEDWTILDENGKFIH
jgi:hypothetical protein